MPAATQERTIMMTRGQLHDLLAKFSSENPKYREALIRDPKAVLERQLNTKLGNTTVKAVVETPDTIYVVVPYAAQEGKLSDQELEKVAGGFLDNLNAQCSVTGGAIASNVAIELG
jgi:hypothetical protein